ncbi:hypothetical protein DFA_08135 [Cavenderia fasciculata]|uniref:Uncharacterized protein n=1 Tax=Cavenderia fasciculata TaxID=261658 RepID=F4Q594_CACFS|nr:uncharacterized protein DFA_08135 [Cavenderia fasciculata]EGG17153.1 hypothetical protein DFA_08135 [Cavenderia fasciculata]|eukprot:XP_004355637.1 hypothetical protein DFA_08135 [Cavenderia fasciculata]
MKLKRQVCCSKVHNQANLVFENIVSFYFKTRKKRKMNRLLVAIVTLLLIVTTTTTTIVSSTSCDSIHLPRDIKLHHLYPDKELYDQIILPQSRDAPKGDAIGHIIDSSKSLFYQLHNLQSNTLYAIRISHTASSPADYKIRFYNPTNNNNNNQNQNKNYDELLKKKPTFQRDILNTEIIKFKTDSNGVPFDINGWNDGQCMILTIESFNTGITPINNRDDKDIRLVSFNLIMDTELFGVPPEIPKMSSYFSLYL